MGHEEEPQSGVEKQEAGPRRFMDVVNDAKRIGKALENAGNLSLEEKTKLMHEADNIEKELELAIENKKDKIEIAQAKLVK